MAEYPFGVRYQRMLIALLLQHAQDVLDVFPEVRSSFFEREVHQGIFRTYRQLTTQLGAFPTVSSVCDRLRLQQQDEAVRECQKLARVRLRTADVRYVIKTFVDFLKFQKLLALFERDVPELLKARKLETLEQRLFSIFEIGQQRSKGVLYFEDLWNRLRRRHQRVVRVVRTLIPELDHNLKHYGVQFGTMSLVLGGTGSGKSMFLTYLAKAAVIQRYRTLYITLQLTEDQVAERLDANFSGVDLGDLMDESRKVSHAVRRYCQRYGSLLKIKFFPAMRLTVSQLGAYLERERSHGFHPEVVIIDYGDLMVGESGFNDKSGRYYESGSVFDQLLGLAQKERIVLWTASQSGRGGYSKSLLTLDDVAESFRRVMAAQLVITINRSPEEKAQRTARLFVAKNTFGPDEFVIPVHTAYERGAFYRKPSSDQDEDLLASLPQELVKRALRKQRG